MNKAILKNCLIHLLLSIADISFIKLLKLESFLSLKQIHRNGFISQCKFDRIRNGGSIKLVIREEGKTF